jgi:hypothetical protein
VADTGAGSEDPDDDHRAARELLRRQLLAGELTEIFQVGGQGFAMWLFGLEPINAAAYQYNSAGERISSAERERIARELSAQRCWAVGCSGILWSEHSPLTTWRYQNGLPPAERQAGVIPWDRIFIERAQIALIIPRMRRVGAFRRTVRALRPSRRRTDETGLFAGVEDDRAQTRSHRRLQDYSPYYPMSHPRRPPYSYVVANYLLDEHPDKTLVVSDPDEIAQISRLRIPREPRPGS